MKTNLKSILAIAATTILVSCSGSSDPEIKEKSHVDAANLFVEQLNEKWIDGEKYDDNRFRLAKAQTQQGADSGYIVIMDRNPDEDIYNSNSGATYFAVSINGWSTYKDAHKHMAKEINFDNAFFNLTDLKNGNYEDYDTGLIFSTVAEDCGGDIRLCDAKEEILNRAKIMNKLINTGMSKGLAMSTSDAMAGFASSNDHSPNAAANAIGMALGKDLSMEDVQGAFINVESRNELLKGLSTADQNAVMSVATDFIMNAK
ncbi:MAG: hypothetical protein KC478_02115 [Bacteriovoracaceae bacterium]|nr:hypothetical protein [Bacteriovoracaceae bacterium]